MRARHMSDSHRVSRLQELFAACVELPHAERDAYVSAHCDDAALRAEVRALLDAHSVPGMLDRLAVHATPSPSAATASP